LWYGLETDFNRAGRTIVINIAQKKRRVFIRESCFTESRFAVVVFFSWFRCLSFLFELWFRRNSLNSNANVSSLPEPQGCAAQLVTLGTDVAMCACQVQKR